MNSHIHYGIKSVVSHLNVVISCCYVVVKFIVMLYISYRALRGVIL